jgi:hypothetical protein
MVTVTDGFGTDDLCCDSSPSECIFKCTDCRGPRFCRKCLLHHHRFSETHQVQVSGQLLFTIQIILKQAQVYRDEFFHKTSLASLGLVVQLNHRNGQCPHNESPTTLFMVYDTNGCHQVQVRYCTCSRSKTNSGHNRVEQLFAQRWFPATWQRPWTVFTFNLLQMFHLLNLQSKCNMYDFYHTILCRQDNAGITHIPVILVCSVSCITL